MVAKAGACLVGKLLDEDEGADEHICSCNVLLEGGEVGRIPQLLEQVAHHLKADLQGTAGA